MKCRSRLLFLQRGKDFRIADIHPAALNGHASDAMAGANHVVDGIGQFVFATRRFLEFGGEVEDHRAKDVDASIVPRRIARLEPTVSFEFLDVSGSWFF